MHNGTASRYYADAVGKKNDCDYRVFERNEMKFSIKKVFIAVCMVFVCATVFAAEKSEKYFVQVVMPELENITGSEKSYIGGQVQDKFKSNLQDYLGMKTLVDSMSELAVVKVQKESESSTRDETTAIELGKISTAKFALFAKIRKTNKGYIVTVDFTDLTTGEQLASATSKEYSEVEYLYGSTGAVDELTVALADKLKITIPAISRNALANGASGFSIDEQLALAKENEAQYKKQVAQYDAEIASLSRSSDLNAVENIKKIEAEKVLLAEKQRAEQKRQEELTAQKKRVAEDEKLERERSIALKTQRDQLAKDAAAKAAEVRKLKIAKQGVLGQISIIESKKKALVGIRNSVEARAQELYAQLVKDRESEEQRILNKNYSTVELGSDGQPTEAAKKRRENQVIKSYEDLTNKFFADCEALKIATQDSTLLAEIRTDQKALATTRTVSSMGDELKVSFGKYEGIKNGWNAYLSLYSDGILLYTDSFIVSYEALSGKSAPNMETELDDAVIEEYTSNVDMYSSLLTRGDPILYFELDYTASAETDNHPSAYHFNFTNIRVINTVSGKTVQTTALNKIQSCTMTPVQDLQEIVGIVASEKENLEMLEDYVAQENSLAVAKYRILVEKDMMRDIGEYFMSKTEVTQKLYQWLMETNPSKFKDENNPVEKVSWYDAIYFCNKLSEKLGYMPVYAVDGKTDISLWKYKPHKGKAISGNITQNTKANGFRLPTMSEWQYAARGGQDFRYAGSNNLDEVGWHDDNSRKTTHSVAQKKPNGYGLYDMSGNVYEWVWDSYGDRNRYACGGSWFSYNDYCECNASTEVFAGWGTQFTGFRIVRTVKK